MNELQARLENNSKITGNVAYPWKSEVMRGRYSRPPY